MKLTSPNFINNSDLPSRYTCQGTNLNPPLIIKEVPENAQSLVLIVDDPDAPGGTWVHWTLWNLSPDTQAIPEAYRAEAPVVEGLTSFGNIGYGGPCPPSGRHRYFFKMYALSQMIDLKSGSSSTELEAAMEGKILASAELMSTYQKV